MNVRFARGAEPSVTIGAARLAGACVSHGNR